MRELLFIVFGTSMVIFGVCYQSFFCRLRGWYNLCWIFFVGPLSSLLGFLVFAGLIYVLIVEIGLEWPILPRTLNEFEWGGVGFAGMSYLYFADIMKEIQEDSHDRRHLNSLNYLSSFIAAVANFIVAIGGIIAIVDSLKPD